MFPQQTPLTHQQATTASTAPSSNNQMALGAGNTGSRYNHQNVASGNYNTSSNNLNLDMFLNLQQQQQATETGMPTSNPADMFLNMLLANSTTTGLLAPQQSIGNTTSVGMMNGLGRGTSVQINQPSNNINSFPFGQQNIPELFTMDSAESVSQLLQQQTFNNSSMIQQQAIASSQNSISRRPVQQTSQKSQPKSDANTQDDSKGEDEHVPHAGSVELGQDPTKQYFPIACVNCRSRHKKCGKFIFDFKCINSYLKTKCIHHVLNV